MRRMATILTVVALAPLLMGGGFGPPPPGFVDNHKLSGPAVGAAAVLKPDLQQFSLYSQQGSIRLEKGAASSGAVFILAVQFTLSCDPVNTLQDATSRFVWTPEMHNLLQDWIPGGILLEIFDQLGITISANNIPVFTDIDKAVCTAYGDGTYALSFTGVVQFLIPKKKL